MTYTALARKWRPRAFSELLGQDHIKHALINSLDQGRIHHAYLFTGTRGVGKTSIARLFAKALNCERGISSIPCLTCSNCLSIEEGRFIDLIEVDAASRTRVEDTRELLENVQYVPSSGRFKIYLIDEVHMLSQHSFNALLKTLEEPPEHVKFLLATTDPHKLPITVLSRCLQFNLKHLMPEAILSHLQTILNEEQLDYDLEALKLIAKAARGSVRDSLSLLDQAIAGCDGKLCTDQIKQLLGYSQQDYALSILQALEKSDPHGLLTISKRITLEGGPFQYVLDELLHHLHQISICQTVPNHAEFITNSPEIQALANHFTPEDIQLFYQIGIKNQDDMHMAPSHAIAFDMMLLRMFTFMPAKQVNLPALSYEEVAPIELVALSKVEEPEAALIEETTAAANPSMNNVLPCTPSSIKPIDLNRHENLTPEWTTLLSKLNLTGLTLSAAENAEFIAKIDHHVHLRIEKGHESVFTPAVVQRIEQALSNHYQEAIKIALECTLTQASTPAVAKRITQENKHQLAEAALQIDPFFQQLQQEFSAELVKSSIAPLEDSL